MCGMMVVRRVRKTCVARDDGDGDGDDGGDSGDEDVMAAVDDDDDVGRRAACDLIMMVRVSARCGRGWSVDRKSIKEDGRLAEENKVLCVQLCIGVS